MALLTLEQMKHRLSQMSYLDWDMNIYEGAFEGYKFEVSAMVEDSTNPGKKVPLHIVSPLYGFFDLRSFDYWVAKRLIVIATHEVLEFLQVGNKPLFDPHREHADRDLL